MRLPGWELRLAEAIEAARTEAFEWGRHDCATWVADVRLALTGEDAARLWRGRYSTARGSLLVLRRLGWASLAVAVSSVLGDPVPPLMAQRGDIVLLGDALGICVGIEALFLAPEGLTARPMSTITTAWRV